MGRLSPGEPHRTAVFVDRDGTLNVDPGYVHRTQDLEFLEGVVEGLLILQATGVPVIVVTNQGGIGLRRYTPEDTLAFHAAMQERLALTGFEFKALYWCPHHPRAVDPSLRTPCACRKPSPGLLLRAAEEHGLDLSSCFFIGDSWRDADAGNQVGCTTIRVDGGGPPGTLPYDDEVPDDRPDHVVAQFDDAARIVADILAHRRTTGKRSPPRS